MINPHQNQQQQDRLRAPPPAVCPYCGLQAVPNIWGDATKSAVYRGGEPFVRMEMHLCPLDHHWWVFLCFDPELTT